MPLSGVDDGVERVLVLRQRDGVADPEARVDAGAAAAARASSIIEGEMSRPSTR